METLQRTANRGSVSTGFNIDNSVKLEADNTEYLNRVIASGGNRKTWTISAWVKRTEISDASHGGGHTIFGVNVSGNEGTIVRFNTGTTAATLDTIQIDIGAGGTLSRSHTSQVFRDTSAWYHIVLAVDTTQSTATDRFKLYVNGELVTSYYSRNNPALNFDTSNNQADNSCTQHIGAYTVSGTAYGKFCGYIAEVNHVDGAALAPTAFGEFDDDSGIWIPIEASPTYGTNGFFLDFADSGNLGDDESGNGLDFTEVNIAAADQSTDTPTNSFCTLNTLSYNHPITLTEGNTKYVKSDGTYGMISGTHYVGAGKWYWEVKATDFGTYSACHFGILDAKKPTVSADERGYEDPSLAATNPEILVMSGAPNNWVMNSNATITNNGAMSSVDYTFNEGDILAMALDMDNGAFWFGNSRYSGVANGSFWVAPGGTSTSGSVATTDPTNGNYALVGNGGGTNNGTPNFNGGTITGGSLLTAGFTLVTPIMGAYHDGVSVTLEANFGGYNSYAEDGGYADGNGYGNFAYSVPSGFYALCTKNIAEFGGSG